MKKTTVTLLIIALIFSLTACNNESPETPSAVSTPETPVETPAPTPTPEPTEPPHIHEWLDANYQQPQTCTDCGETEGEPLTPGFELSGYTINAELDVVYPYVTIQWDRNDPTYDPNVPYGNIVSTIPLVGEITFTEFRVFESEEDLPPVDGYEYKSVKVLITYNNDDVKDGYGWGAMAGADDYYIFDADYVQILDSEKPESDIPGFVIESRELSYNGSLYEYYTFSSGSYELVGNTAFVNYEFCFLSPVGYDGHIAFATNAGNWIDGATSADFIDEDALLFRLK